MKDIIEKYGIYRLKKSYLISDNVNISIPIIDLLKRSDVVPDSLRIIFNSSYIPEFYRLKYDLPIEKEATIIYNSTFIHLGLNCHRYNINDKEIIRIIKSINNEPILPLLEQYNYKSTITRYSGQAYLTVTIEV